MKQLTLGSLFDGSGGFPLAGKHVGIKPIWASEIEPFPIRVTTNRLPEMKHLGDITKINGAEIEPVDIVTSGSPCQSFSCSGDRTGLEGKSGLFYEAVRVISEMRKATNNKYPRYVLIENVPGMLTCTGGEDFNEVLSELTALGGQRNQCPRPKKWEKAGSIMGDSFSLAWRILDAQFFRLAQSRRRVFIILCIGANGGGQKTYSLSAKCLKGILRRAIKKERCWPTVLVETVLRMIQEQEKAA